MGTWRMYLPAQSSFVASSAGQMDTVGFLFGHPDLWDLREGAATSQLLQERLHRGWGGPSKAQTTVCSPRPSQAGSWASLAEATQLSSHLIPTWHFKEMGRRNLPCLSLKEDISPTASSSSNSLIYPSTLTPLPL